MTNKNNYAIVLKNKEIHNYLKSQSTLIDSLFEQYRLEWEETSKLNEDCKVVMTISEWHNEDIFGWLNCYCTKKAIDHIRKELCIRYPRDSIEIETLDSQKETLKGERTTYINNKVVAYRKFKQKALPPYNYIAKYYDYNEDYNRMCLVKTRAKKYQEYLETTTTKTYQYDEHQGKDVLVNKDVHIEDEEDNIVPESLLYFDQYDPTIDKQEFKKSNLFYARERDRFISLLLTLHYEWYYSCSTVYYDAPVLVKEHFKSSAEGVSELGMDYYSPLTMKESYY